MIGIYWDIKWEWGIDQQQYERGCPEMKYLPPIIVWQCWSRKKVSNHMGRNIGVSHEWKNPEITVRTHGSRIHRPPSQSISVVHRSSKFWLSHVVCRAFHVPLSCIVDRNLARPHLLVDHSTTRHLMFARSTYQKSSSFLVNITTKGCVQPQFLRD